MLRPPRTEEAAQYVRWFEDPDVFRYTLQIGPLSIWQEQDFIKRMAVEQNAVSWVIEVDVRPVGWTGVGGINWRIGNGESGIYIGYKSLWGKCSVYEAST